MTPRLRLSRRDPSWSWTELFKATHTLRNLRVVVDAELLDGDPAAWTAGNLLAGFLTHDDIDFWRYSDNGPPPGTPVLVAPSGQMRPLAGPWPYQHRKKDSIVTL